jgi:ADP-heptose:LPS heptosyltransferase
MFLSARRDGIIPGPSLPIAREARGTRLVVVNDPSIGDALMCAPVVEALARAHAPAEVYVAWRNREVGEIIALPENALPVEAIPRDWSILARDVTQLDTWSAYGYGQPTVGHPTQYVFRQAGLPAPLWDNLPRPRLRQLEEAVATVAGEHEAVPDFIVAPFTRDPLLRDFPWQEYPRLFRALNAVYPGCDILVIGGAEDREKVAICVGDTPVRSSLGLPLAVLARLMQLARIAVITVCSGPSHLAWAARVTTHLILTSSRLPPGWVTYPGALVHRSPNTSLPVEQILEILKPV